LSGADLEASIGGGDVERGEAVVEGGAAGEGSVGGEVGGQGVEVPELRGAEEVVLVAGAGAAHPVPHAPISAVAAGEAPATTPPAAGEVG
jgi:hypothetical protein